jgi:hypothetical protein
MSKESSSIGVGLPLHGKVSKLSLLSAFSLPITKLMVTLLLAGIGLDILHTVQAQAGQGWGTDLAILAKAMAGSAILLGIIAKAPDAVASIAGVSTGGLGHGVGTFVTAAGLGFQAGGWTGGAAAQGGKQLGQAVRNAVKQGQALSRSQSPGAALYYPSDRCGLGK